MITMNSDCVADIYRWNYLYKSRYGQLQMFQKKILYIIRHTGYFIEFLLFHAKIAPETISEDEKWKILLGACPLTPLASALHVRTSIMPVHHSSSWHWTNWRFLSMGLHVMFLLCTSLVAIILPAWSASLLDYNPQKKFWV